MREICSARALFSTLSHGAGVASRVTFSKVPEREELSPHHHEIASGQKRTHRHADGVAWICDDNLDEESATRVSLGDDQVGDSELVNCRGPEIQRRSDVPIWRERDEPEDSHDSLAGAQPLEACG